MSDSQRPRVIIIGGGFGGLAAARALAKAPVDVTLIDRRNHHVFQPLLYQVATAALSPAQISAPIRTALRLRLGESGFSRSSAERRLRGQALKNSISLIRTKGRRVGPV